MPATGQKILIIRFSSIGDIVLTTPVIRGLLQQLDAEVHFLTKRSFAGIVEVNPYVHKVWTIERKVGEVLPQLQAEGFDAVIDLHKNLRSGQVRLGLSAKTYSFDKLNWEKWLLVNLKLNRMPARHIVDRYLAAARPLGIKNDGQGLDYFIPPEQKVDVVKALNINEPYLGLVIGAAHVTKRLPSSKLIELCQALTMPIVLLGGPNDRDNGAMIARSAGSHVYNACGGFSLHQSASLVQQANVIVTHDTGLMHIAAAFRKPIISVWGNTVPDFGMYPYLPAKGPAHQIVEVKDLSCRPCSKIGYAKCPKGHFRCMQQIDILSIVTAIKGYFA